MDTHTKEAIQQLEQQHEHLIGELDALNTRLEQALNSLARKPLPDELEASAAEEQPASLPPVEMP